MSAIDYPGLLAQLEQQRIASVQEIEDLDVIIAAVRKRAGVSPTEGYLLPSAKSQPVPPSNGGSTDRLAGARLDEARRLWDAGVKPKEIGRRLGVSAIALGMRAKKLKWPPRNGHGAAAKTSQPAAAPKPVATPAGHKLSGTVRCNHCERMTGFDPCEHCHKTLTRKW